MFYIVSKCHCKNQLQNAEYKLELVGDRPVFAGICDRGHANNVIKQEESHTPDRSQTQSKVLPTPGKVLVTLRLQVDSCRPGEVLALIKILVDEIPVRCRIRRRWI